MEEHLKRYKKSLPNLHEQVSMSFSLERAQHWMEIYRVTNMCRHLKVNYQGRSKTLDTKSADHTVLHFLFPEPRDRSSKLLSVSSRPPLVAEGRVKDDLDSKPG